MSGEGSVLDFRCTSSETRISDRPPVKSRTGFAHYVALLHASTSTGVPVDTDDAATQIDNRVLESVVLYTVYLF